jgi:hypothetical protein
MIHNNFAALSPAITMQYSRTQQTREFRYLGGFPSTTRESA